MVINLVHRRLHIVWRGTSTVYEGGPFSLKKGDKLRIKLKGLRGGGFDCGFSFSCGRRFSIIFKIFNKSRRFPVKLENEVEIKVSYFVPSYSVEVNPDSFEVTIPRNGNYYIKVVRGYQDSRGKNENTYSDLDMIIQLV